MHLNNVTIKTATIMNDVDWMKVPNVFRLTVSFLIFHRVFLIQRMSFEMVVVSDQLRTFVGFNYAEVNVNEGVQDVFGGVFPSKLGYDIFNQTILKYLLSFHFGLFWRI